MTHLLSRHRLVVVLDEANLVVVPQPGLVSRIFPHAAPLDQELLPHHVDHLDGGPPIGRGSNLLQPFHQPGKPGGLQVLVAVLPRLGAPHGRFRLEDGDKVDQDVLRDGGD